MKKLYTVIALLTLFSPVISFAMAEADQLNTLSRTSEEIRALRLDIRTAIKIVKSNKSEEHLPELKFYKYSIKEGDSFWNIIARTTLNIDTLMTVNQLESPSDITKGATIYVPNMRGVVHRVSETDTLADIGFRYQVNPSYIKKLNNITTLSKEYLFIPCGNVTREERSAFLAPQWRNPLDVMHITSRYGNRVDPFTGNQAFHSGIDLRCKAGTAVRSTKAGRVTFSGISGNYGLLVIVAHKGGYRSYYGHLHSSSVKVGDVVSGGKIIARSGNSGRSTGPHLHFEVRCKDRNINPLTLLR